MVWKYAYNLKYKWRRDGLDSERLVGPDWHRLECHARDLELSLAGEIKTGAMIIILTFSKITPVSKEDRS